MFAKLLDLDHPFFLPMWRRYATIAVCVVWATAEWATHSPFWATLATGTALYCIYALLWNFDEAKARALDKADRDA